MRPRNLEATTDQRDLLRLMERIIKRSSIDPETGCYRWGGDLTNSYIRTSIKTGGVSTKFQIHRVAYAYLAGPIPDDHDIDHVAARGCRYLNCWNVAHLEAVPHRVNLQRSAPATRTHCRHGHEYTPETTYRGPDGKRKCRTCQTDQVRAFYQRQHDAGIKITRRLIICDDCGEEKPHAAHGRCARCEKRRRKQTISTSRQSMPATVDNSAYDTNSVGDSVAGIAGDA
jgi:hypothetical protein